MDGTHYLGQPIGIRPTHLPLEAPARLYYLHLNRK